MFFNITMFSRHVFYLKHSKHIYFLTRSYTLSGYSFQLGVYTSPVKLSEIRKVPLLPLEHFLSVIKSARTKLSSAVSRP